MSDGLIRTAEGFRTAYRETLGHIDSLTSALDDASWNAETGCPGWSVRDIVAHVAALESILIGREPPDHTLPEGLAHVRSQMGEWTELGVDYRRGWPISRLTTEYREVVQTRLQRLASLRDDELEQPTQFYFGPTVQRNALTIRIFDLWSHEQDIRRITDQPGGFDDVAAYHSREMLARGVGRVTAERCAPADGTVLLLDITGSGATQRLITFNGGKSRVSDEPPASPPDVTLTLDMNTLTVLGCGRADDPGARERVRIDGDEALGRRILEDIAITP